MIRVIVPLLTVACSALAQPSQGYAGSAACKSCHAAVYNHWSKTLMANVVRDPKRIRSDPSRPV